MEAQDFIENDAWTCLKEELYELINNNKLSLFISDNILFGFRFKSQLELRLLPPHPKKKT